MAKVKLHRCAIPTPGFLTGYHPCAAVERALRDANVDYEVVHDSILRFRRKDVEKLTGQKLLPLIEFEDGTAYRAESKEMAEKIQAGKLFEGRSAP